MNKISKSQYSELVKKKSPNSKLAKDLIAAFAVGGIICVIGELISMFIGNFNLSKEDTSSIVSSAMIFLGASLTGFGIYARIARFAGAGTLVPITGFSNSIVSPAIEYRTEGYVTGVGAKMFVIAGPVLVYGISASVIYGIIYYITTL